MSEKKKLIHETKGAVTPSHNPNRVKSPVNKKILNIKALGQLIRKKYPVFNLQIGDLKGEVWQNVQGYKGVYQVSNLGRVKSFLYYSYNKGRVKGAIMKQTLAVSLTQQPIFRVKFRKNGNEKRFSTDKLVGEAFIGEKKRNEVYAHINKDVIDSRSENLRIITKGDNKKLNYEFYFIRLSDNKKFLRDELEKEYKKPYQILVHNIDEAIRRNNKGYGNFWRKEIAPGLFNRSVFSDIRMAKISNGLRKQLDSAFTKKYVFTKSKKNKNKKHISVSKYRAHHEKRRVKLTESERKKYAGFNIQLEDLNGEKWEDIPGYDGVYFVSNLGRVKSCSRYTPHGRWIKGIILKQSLRIHNKTRMGLSLNLTQNKIVKHFQVSTLVGMAFIRERKSNEVYVHFNKDQLDNRLINIRIKTKSEDKKLDFTTNVRLNVKYEFIRLADGKRLLHHDIVKEYGSKGVVTSIYSGIQKKQKRYGSFWEKRILK